MDQALMVRPTLRSAVGDAPVRPRKNSEIIHAEKSQESVMVRPCDRPPRVTNLAKFAPSVR